MTTQLEQAAKLALEALECLVDTEQSFGALDYGDNAISALRNALAQPTQDTAVGSFLFGGGRWNQVDAEYENDHDVVKLYRTPQQPAQDKPVGEVLNERGEVDWISFVPAKGTLLYTHAQKREWKGLTEEEDHECWVKAHTEGIDSNWIDTDLLLELREVKLKEKNQ